MNKTKIVYFTATGLLSLLMLFSVGMYVFIHGEIIKAFEHLGYPTYIIYPLAIAKILGLIAIWSNYSKSLKEWAYAGFFFDFILAWSAHYFAGDGAFSLTVPALIFLAASYFSGRKLYEKR